MYKIFVIFNHKKKCLLSVMSKQNCTVEKIVGLVTKQRIFSVSSLSRCSYSVPILFLSLFICFSLSISLLFLFPFYFLVYTPISLAPLSHFPFLTLLAKSNYNRGAIGKIKNTYTKPRNNIISIFLYYYLPKRCM